MTYEYGLSTVTCLHNSLVAFVLAAKVHAPSCLKRGKRRLIYLWTCDHPGLEFNDEKPTLNIKADQFSAGQVRKMDLFYKFLFISLFILFFLHSPFENYLL